MSKIKKQVETRVVTRESLKCDLCGLEADGLTFSDDASLGAGHVGAGWSCKYDGCNDGTESADLCLDCWNEKVKPALNALGVKFY